MVQQTDALPLPLTVLSHLHILTTSPPKRFGATPTEVDVNLLSARGYTSVYPWLHTGCVSLFFRKVLLIISGSPAFGILILVLWSVAKVLMIVISYLVSRPDRPSHVWLCCALEDLRYEGGHSVMLRSLLCGLTEVMSSPTLSSLFGQAQIFYWRIQLEPRYKHGC